MTIGPDDRRQLLTAVVSLATQEGLGEEVFWDTIEPALIELIGNPTADRDLRRFLPKINEIGVIETLEDWFTRAARERGADARKSGTNSDELVTPLKRIGMGFGGAGIIGTVLGSAALPVALPLIGLGLVLTGGGMLTGLRLKRKADEASFDRDLLDRLAEICREERLRRN